MSSARSTLKLSQVILPLLLFFLVCIPVAYWLGWHQTRTWAYFEVPWMASPYPAWALGLIGLLILAPLCWIWLSRVIDFLALTLLMQGLMIAGYFFLDRTAERLNVVSATLPDPVMRMGGLVLLFNGIGFLVLLLTTGVVYTLCAGTNARNAPPPAPVQVLDQRMVWLLRAASLVLAMVLAMPMLLTRSIPMLSADPTAARQLAMSSDVGRALYLAGSSFLPFVIGGLALMVWRSPRRLVHFEGAALFVLVCIQYATSNRTPLMISLLVFLALWSMERRRSRFLLLAAALGYLLFVTFFSGLTGLLRTARLGGGNVLQASLQEAFLGDNLIDVRDASWVMARWDFVPLGGRTYLGGAFAMLPSAVFPQKKQWHMGLTAIRVVGFPETHFGLRITNFGEAFMNFGMAGVAGVAILVGTLFGVLLRKAHLAAAAPCPSLWYNLKLAVMFQLVLLLHNSSEGYSFWTLLLFVGAIKLLVELNWDLLRPSSRKNQLQPLAAQ